LPYRGGGYIDKAGDAVHHVDSVARQLRRQNRREAPASNLGLLAGAADLGSRRLNPGWGKRNRHSLCAARKAGCCAACRFPANHPPLHIHSAADIAEVNQRWNMASADLYALLRDAAKRHNRLGSQHQAKTAHSTEGQRELARYGQISLPGHATASSQWDRWHYRQNADHLQCQFRAQVLIQWFHWL
jgi:lysophospholipase L1-like esterase